VIAILGATGYIGRSLAREISSSAAEPLVLFARRPDALADAAWPGHVSIQPLDRFRAGEFDIVVNAIGAGAPSKVAALGPDILGLTRIWDERVLETMGAETGYVFLSSGAVYGSGFDRPVDEDSELSIPVNRLESVSAYGLAKLYAEAGHRIRADLAILDVRVFGYADISVPLASRFFLADLVRSVARRETLITSPDPMVRDYVGARELRALIDCWRAAKRPNAALDVYSRAPVDKQALLDLAASRYGLKIRMAETAQSPTGAKPVFASSFRAAADIGYAPQRSSFDIVAEVLDEAARLAGSGSGR
jgi:nucleoside-diphosphate-sugar epimerase